MFVVFSLLTSALVQVQLFRILSKAQQSLLDVIPVKQ